MTHTLSSNGDAKILKITDSNGDATRLVAHESHIMIPGARSGDPHYAIVEGSDLAALRDLINAMPEEAFADPASAWVDGDVVVFTGRNRITYLRQDGAWTRIAVSIRTNGSRVSKLDQFDAAIDNMLAGMPDRYVVAIRGGEPVDNPA